MRGRKQEKGFAGRARIDGKETQERKSSKLLSPREAPCTIATRPVEAAEEA